MTKKELNDRSLVRRALKRLVKAGYLVPKCPFWDCSSCGTAAIHTEWHRLHPRTKRLKYTFWHDQDDEHAFDEAGNLTRHVPLFIRWDGKGEEIVEALRDAGLRAFWSGNEDACIQVWGRVGR